MNPNINNEQFEAAKKPNKFVEKLIAAQRKYADGLSADGIDLDEWGSGPDLRGKVMWGLADGSLPVYNSDWEHEEDGWGTECARCSSARTKTLLVGDDPEHTLEGTPLCREHYLAEHGHKMPHYIIHPDDKETAAGVRAYPRERYTPNSDVDGQRTVICDAVTPQYHPAVTSKYLPGVRRVPRRSFHGSTQHMEVGDIVEPRGIPGGRAAAAFSTLNPNVALSYAEGIVGNYNQKTGTFGKDGPRGPVRNVYEVEPVDPTEEVENGGKGDDGAKYWGIPHKKGLRVVGVMGTTTKGLGSLVLNRRAALEQGAQEGRSITPATPARTEAEERERVVAWAAQLLNIKPKSF